MLAESLISLVKTARYDRSRRRFVAELIGGLRVTVERAGSSARPSLPPGAPVITTTGEPVEAPASGPGLAKAPALRLVKGRAA